MHKPGYLLLGPRAANKAATSLLMSSSLALLLFLLPVADAPCASVSALTVYALVAVISMKEEESRHVKRARTRTCSSLSSAVLASVRLSSARCSVAVSLVCWASLSRASSASSFSSDATRRRWAGMDLAWSAVAMSSVGLVDSCCAGGKEMPYQIREPETRVRLRDRDGHAPVCIAILSRLAPRRGAGIGLDTHARQAVEARCHTVALHQHVLLCL